MASELERNSNSSIDKSINKSFYEIEKKDSNSNDIELVERCEQKTSKIEMDVDSILMHIGELGRAQVFWFVIYGFLLFPILYQTLVMAFIAIDPPWSCNNNNNECNRTGVFTAEHDFYEKRCTMNRSSWKYEEDKKFSIVTEWDLVCDKITLSYIANSATFIGGGVGSIIAGIAADRYGRRRILIPSWIATIVLAFSTAFVNNVWFFIVLRIFTGIFQGGVFVTEWVLITELLGHNYRNYCNALWCSSAFALSFMALQAWLIYDWRLFQIVLSAPYLILAISFRYMPESVRWLRLKNRCNSAESILIKFAKFNKKTWPNATLSKISSDNANNQQISIIYVFYPWKTCFKTSIQALAWFCTGLAFYGISLASNNLSGNLHRDFSLIAFVDFPANLFAVWFCSKFGRKKTTIFSIVSGGLLIFTLSFVPSQSGYIWMRVAMGVIGKFFITICQSGLYVWSAELFPTSIRSQGMGVCSLATVIGAATSPWVAQFLNFIHPILPLCLMGALCVISGVVCMYLSETHGKATIETVEK